MAAFIDAFCTVSLLHLFVISGVHYWNLPVQDVDKDYQEKVLLAIYNLEFHLLAYHMGKVVSTTLS